MYTVKHASTLTGVPVDTLRMWERRYGVVDPERNESGYRLYDDAAIARLIAMHALVQAGWPARRAALQVMSGSPATDVDAPAGELVPPTTRVLEDLNLLVDLAVAFDGESLTRELDRVFADHEVEELLDGWLMLALARLGDSWRQGRISVAAEHFVSAGVHRRLASVLDTATRDTGSPRVLIGLARGSRHELGVPAFAALLARTGTNVGYVGGDVPPDSWVVAATVSDPSAVVLGVPNLQDVAPVRDVVTALNVVRPHLPVFLGGAHQDRIGTGIPLGHALTPAVHILAKELQAHSTSPR